MIALAKLMRRTRDRVDPVNRTILQPMLNMGKLGDVSGFKFRGKPVVAFDPISALGPSSKRKDSYAHIGSIVLTFFSAQAPKRVAE
jgi:hypothetical protein